MGLVVQLNYNSVRISLTEVTYAEESDVYDSLVEI